MKIQDRFPTYDKLRSRIQDDGVIQILYDFLKRHPFIAVAIIGFSPLAIMLSILLCKAVGFILGMAIVLAILTLIVIMVMDFLNF